MKNYTERDVLSFVRENDVKFVRLAFCDLFGIPKNIAVMAQELPKVFESGAAFDACGIDGFVGAKDSNLMLIPDPKTLTVLPWRPTGGRVVRMICDIKKLDGSDYIADCRSILKKVLSDSENLDYGFNVGIKNEFYLFKLDEDGNVTDIPFDSAGYCDIAPKDKGENVRREICLTLEEMGIVPTSSHHEKGPGQNQIDFEHSAPLEAADNIHTFKTVVNTVSSKYGLHASFEPKPIADKNGSGMSFTISLFGKHGIISSRIAKSFIAGIMRRISEITAFLNPAYNSYERFGKFGAPKYITWSSNNSVQLIRLPDVIQRFGKIEVRSPDSLANPYLTIALLLAAGNEGVRDGLQLCDSGNDNDGREHEALPKSLNEALALADRSEFVKSVIPESVVEEYIRSKLTEGQ